jgi:membrane protein implicated in regulation of membrane protease activity
MILFWAAGIVVFLIIEAVTFGIAAIWFSIGSLAALISAALGAPLWLQITWFAAISGLTFCFTRPFIRKYVNSRRQATNADRVIGHTGKVTQAIDNIISSGTVTVDGKLWSARSADGEGIASGELVTILRIEGVKLIVEKVRQEITQ